MVSKLTSPIKCSHNEDASRGHAQKLLFCDSLNAAVFLSELEEPLAKVTKSDPVTEKFLSMAQAGGNLKGHCSHVREVQDGVEEEVVHESGPGFSTSAVLPVAYPLNPHFASTGKLIKYILQGTLSGHRQTNLLTCDTHRDVSESDAAFSDESRRFLSGLFDYSESMNWKELLRKVGREDSEASWKSYVEKHGCTPWVRLVHPRAKASPTDSAKDKVDNEVLVAVHEEWEMKERMGALHFVAIDIVEMQVYYVHDVRHDMESFFWVLLWVVLQYTRTAYRPTSRRYRPRAKPSSVVIKGYFLLTSMDWIVVDNRPLTTLVLEYKKLCYAAMEKSTGEVVPLTYEAVLAVLSEALASSDWPQGDCALSDEMIPKSTPTSCKANIEY